MMIRVYRLIVLVLLISIYMFVVPKNEGHVEEERDERPLEARQCVASNT